MGVNIGGENAPVHFHLAMRDALLDSWTRFAARERNFHLEKSLQMKPRSARRDISQRSHDRRVPQEI